MQNYEGTGTGGKMVQQDGVNILRYNIILMSLPCMLPQSDWGNRGSVRSVRLARLDSPDSHARQTWATQT